MKNKLAIFKKNKPKAVAALKEGKIDYVAESRWSFANKFFSFLLAIGFFAFVEETYPSPRMRKNIPLWILIGLMLQLKLNLGNSFFSLPGILKSGAVLTRTSFNIGKVGGGVGKRNKYPWSEGEIVNQDILRKYFKDTGVAQLQEWNNIQVSLIHESYLRWENIFYGGTHIVAPDNKNYEEAQYVPLIPVTDM